MFSEVQFSTSANMPADWSYKIDFPSNTFSDCSYKATYQAQGASAYDENADDGKEP